MSALMSFDDALTALLSAASPVREEETVALVAALGRVLAAEVVSPIAIPSEDTSAMDGYAVRAADVPKEGTTLPISQRIPAGSVGVPLVPGTAARIFTGAPLPPGADAVVMQERTEVQDGAVTFWHVPQPGEAVRRAGREVAIGQRVLAAGQRLRPQDIAIAASIGCAQLTVRRRLRVAVLATGDELIEPGQPLGPGQIYNSNAYQLEALLLGLGCEVHLLGRVPDTLPDTRAALRRAAQIADVILTTGGVSVGEEDHVKAAVQAEGELALWRLAIKPGKPLAFGRIGAAHVVGLPGNPVSSFVTFVLLVRPFLLRLMGVAEALPRPWRVPAGFDWPRPDPRREFLRVRLGEEGRLALFPDQGSATIASLVWADGLAEVPESTAVRAGEPLRYWPLAQLLA